MDRVQSIRMSGRVAGFVLTAFILFAAAGVGNAETAIYGAEAGWEGTLSEGLRETDGWKGRRALTLAPLGRNPFLSDVVLEGDIRPEDIDLLLLSEIGGIENPAGHYRIEGNWTVSDLFPARGETSIRPGAGGILLHPTESALWAPGREWGDFTLDFRLRPVTLSDGEIFFSWQGRNEDGDVQSVIARIENRRLIWTFRGFFRHGSDRSLTLTLVSSPLIPGEWRHHRIRFKRGSAHPGSSGASPGLLEYLVDGVPTDMVHATPDGREGTEPFSPRVGALSDGPLILAPSFGGYIDEFRIASAYAARSPAGGYSDREAAAAGAGRTEAVDSGYPGSSLTGIRARYEAPGASRVRFYAKAVDTRAETWLVKMPAPGMNGGSWTELTMVEEPDDPTGFGRWYRWEADEPFKGRYFIIGYVLDPDPGADIAPVLSSLEVEFAPRLPPRPPRDLRKEQDGEGIRMSWSPDAEDGVAGWWVSWGPRPGDYVPTSEDDTLHGMAWVPRRRYAPGERPDFSWPDDLGDRIIYTSVRAAWEEGTPADEMSPDDGGYRKPRNYEALSEPTREMNFRP